jgi:NAD(P)-dependent dehydrogenase (short-subunit alcohol dehydrogenase family)
MKLDFEGQVVLVTGAGRGNGAAIARAFGAAGARVAVVDRNLETAAAVAAQIGAEHGSAEAFELDVSDPHACVQAAAVVRERLGSVNVLVNNAGILLRGAFGQGDALGDWERTLGVNLSGPYHMALALLDQLKATRGCILNVGSIQSFVATPNSVPYTASKGGVAQLTKALASELAPHGVRVNAIAPGFMVTPMTAGTLADPDKTARLLAHVPMQRPGEAAELAGPALFLCSIHASYVTGAILPVDGGYLSV